MVARDIMLTAFPVVTPNTPLGEVYRAMQSCDLPALPVVDEQGSLVGIVSEDDLLRAVLPVYADTFSDLGFLPRSYRFHGYDQERLSATQAREVLSKQHLVAADPEERVAELAHLMLEHDLAVVPVVEADRVVGLVTRRSLLGHIVAPSLGCEPQE